MFGIAAVIAAVQCAQVASGSTSQPVHPEGVPARAESSLGRDDDHRFFLSSPYLSFTNWLGENIDMYELHAGYRASARDKIGLKAATWRLNKPLGIPLWSSSLFNDSEFYGGRVREYGIGPFYQRMIWKGLFAGVEAMIMRKTFLSASDQALDHGVRVYTSFHLGYYIPFFGDRLFIEPQVHCNYWPVDSQGPPSFRDRDAKWKNYFLFEPNLYIGVNL